MSTALREAAQWKTRAGQPRQSRAEPQQLHHLGPLPTDPNEGCGTQHLAESGEVAAAGTRPLLLSDEMLGALVFRSGN